MSYPTIDFGSLVSDVTGGNKKYQTFQYKTKGSVPVVDQGKNLVAGFVDEVDFAFNISKPVIIFGDHTKAIKYVDFPFVLGADGVKILKPNDNLNAKYLYYYLQTIKLPDAGYNRHFKYLKETKIPLPPLPVQKKIAAILDKADSLRQKDKQLIDRYNELGRSIFYEMFGDPVRNNKGWLKTELSNFGHVITGNTPPREFAENYSPKFIEWIKTDNIIENELIISNASEHLSEQGLKKGRSVPKGSLLVTCIAGSKESLGRSALTDRQVSFNQQINALVPNAESNSFFLYWLFKISRKFIQDYATNGMKKIITKGDFESIRMILPPREVQDRFSIIIMKLHNSLTHCSHTGAQTQALFQSLLQSAFKGELVKE